MDNAAVAAAIIAGSTIVSVVEILKEALRLPDRFARLAALIVGAALGLSAAALTSGDYALGAASGFVAGIGATASYAVAKRNAAK